MLPFTVYVTRPIPAEGIDLLRQSIQTVVVRDEEDPPTKEELLHRISGVDALLCLLTDTIDSEAIEAGRRLRVIANYAVGYDNIDVAAATRKGIMVTNTPGVLTETTADMAWCLLMAVARRVVEADSYVRRGQFRRWEPMLLLGSDVYGKTLGIVGMGRIGRAVARRARGFGMKILYYSRRRAYEVEKETGARYVDLPMLLKNADFVTLHTPLTAATRHMIGRKELEMMKPTSYLINTSRGAVIDEAALVKALEEGLIAGAALDVYENEPKLSEGLAELSNVVLTPHIGSASRETRTRMALMAAENIVSALSGERPPNLVNPEALAKGQRSGRGRTDS